MHGTVAHTAVYIRSESDVAALFARDIAHAAVEHMRAIHLDQAQHLLGITFARPGSRHGLRVPIRAIVEDALALASAGVVLIHNHPSGNPAPSRADRTITRRLGDVLHALDVRLHDHIIFAGTQSYSFRAHGLL